MNFAKSLHSFFHDYLPKIKGVSNNTVKAYRDTFKIFLLFVTEYQRIKIGDRFDPANRMISQRQADQLERITDSLGLRVFTWGRRSLVPQQFVGVIPLGDIRIEILPKIDDAQGEEDGTTVQRLRLLELLGLTKSLPVHEAGMTSLRHAKGDLLEIYIRVFAEHLAAELRKGIIHRYEKRVENLSVLRGKLLLPNHITVTALSQNKPLNSALRDL